jgi:hypothetical protein
VNTYAGQRGGDDRGPIESENRWLHALAALPAQMLRPGGTGAYSRGSTRWNRAQPSAASHSVAVHSLSEQALGLLMAAVW